MFANVTNPLDFDDAENAPATQELELDAKLLDTSIPLRFVKFQNVQNLTIFIKDNLGDEDVTALRNRGFYWFLVYLETFKAKMFKSS